MRKGVTFALAVVFGVASCFSILICSPLEAQTKKITAVEGVKFDTSVSMADNLKTYIGKDVTVHLRSGKTIQGYVKAVGTLLHLEKIAGKDFYDALVRVDEISSLEVKFRDMK